jgi:uncharacterized protein YtpQ (UPF0354 family)
VPPLLTPKQFTQAHVAALKEQIGDLEIKIPQDLEVEVVLKDNRLKFSLERAYGHEYALERQGEDELIGRFVAGVVESVRMVRDTTHNPARFVPLIKRREWLEAQEPELLHDAFGADLVVVYAEDRPNTIYYLAEKDIESAGVAREDLRALSIGNLSKLLTIKEEHSENGVYLLNAGGDYEASLILVDWILEHYQEKITGQPVVAIPIASAFLLTGSGNTEGLHALKQAISWLSEDSDRLLTTQMFIYKGNGRFSVVRF